MQAFVDAQDTRRTDLQLYFVTHWDVNLNTENLCPFQLQSCSRGVLRQVLRIMFETVKGFPKSHSASHQPRLNLSCIMYSVTVK